jgi:hypothetical protein
MYRTQTTCANSAFCLGRNLEVVDSWVFAIYIYIHIYIYIYLALRG